MPPEDQDSTGRSRPQAPPKPLWFRRARQAGVGVLFGLLSAGVLAHLIFLPHVLTAGTLVCFVAAGVIGVRAAGRDPNLPAGPAPGTSARPFLAQAGRVALVVALFAAGVALWVLRLQLLG
ncbi:MAG: hypothetical protein GEV03_14585 [Streptosporangiales bacterium]|nr:hypothetical protein [Streptosporangiales bacterium]